MNHVRQMHQSHPKHVPVNTDTLVECIETCFDCAQSCTSCADACLGEQNVNELVRCIRLNQDCADVCEATGHILSRQTEFEPEVARTMLHACAQACQVCGDECERHAPHHEHCRVCAESCRSCKEACDRLISEIAV